MRYLTALLLSVLVFPAFGKDYQLQALEDAHASFRSATNAVNYAEAAAMYESLIHEEGIRNGNLFYTTGNSWFMAGDVGRAILNYRRAEQYMPNNTDLKHNLQAALDMRADLIPEKEAHPVAEKLLGWHLNTPTPVRWILFAIVWFGFWGALFWMQRSTRKEAKVSTIASGLISLALLISLVTEGVVKTKARPGVITAPEVVARKGDGNMYAPAFLDPLHAGTEFQRMEDRGQWWHVELANGQTCWLPSDAAETVSLR